MGSSVDQTQSEAVRKAWAKRKAIDSHRQRVIEVAKDVAADPSSENLANMRHVLRDLDRTEDAPTDEF